MYIRFDRTYSALAVVLGILTLACVAVLFLWDAAPRSFPAGSHDALGAIPLALIAVAYLVYQRAQRRSGRELIKAVMLAAAFLFWAANQFWPDSPHALLYNDVAIGLFVLDVVLVIVGRPAISPDDAFAQTDTRVRAGMPAE